MNGELIDRKKLRAGDIICRRAANLQARLILWATKGPWNHDAIIIEHDGQKFIGDATAITNCQLTVPYEWESGCVRKGHKIIVLRPWTATEADGKRAADWWMQNVHGKKYDKAAIVRLGLKVIFGDWISKRVGLMSHFYCTEGCRDAWEFGAGKNPWWPKVNATPGTTYRRYVEGRFVEVADALTPMGRKHRVNAGRKTQNVHLRLDKVL